MSAPKNIQHLFPGLNSKQNQDLIYFDNAATTQKPFKVIDAITEFYSKNNSNIHRSSHSLGAAATKQYESARQNVCEFISANKSSEIIFTSGATEGINLVAHSYGDQFVTKGDLIVVSSIEHHSLWFEAQDIQRLIDLLCGADGGQGIDETRSVMSIAAFVA